VLGRTLIPKVLGLCCSEFSSPIRLLTFGHKSHRKEFGKFIFNRALEKNGRMRVEERGEIISTDR
jgi:hypothetical protein